MPAEIFDISSPDFKKLKKFFKRAPKQFQRAAAGVLTSFAFGSRKTTIRTIGKKMVIRNPRFVNSRIRVDKARPSQDMDTMHSEMGSIISPRFSGWVEQQTGKKSKRTRIQTLLSRGNSVQNIIRPGFRIKPGTDFTTPDEFKGKFASHRVIVMLNTLKRRNFRKPFVIKRHKKFRPGLYKFVRNKVKLLQDFKPTDTQPKRIPWLTLGVELYFKTTDITRVWSKQIKRVLKFK